MKKKQRSMLGMVIAFLAAGLFLPGLISGGDLEPPGGPDDPGSAMYTIEDIYNYLDTGVAGSKRSGGFVEPTSPPGSTGHTLDDVHAKIAERCITCEGTLSALGRWCDNGNGTVTDMSTGLVWLKMADWGGEKPWRHFYTYDDAHTRAGILQADTAGANLSDGSTLGDWRLPTKNELITLTNGTEQVRPNTPRFFTGVQSYFYWSSTTYAGNTNYAWSVDMNNGLVYDDGKTNSYYVWPVRGGN